MKPKIILVFTTLFLIVIFTALFLLESNQSVVQAMPITVNEIESPSGEEPFDETCLGCHQLPGQSITLESGEELYISVDPETHMSTIHGSQGIQCVQCHTNISEYPHPELTAGNLREYSHLFDETCSTCHQGQYDYYEDSIHFDLLEQGNLNAPTCSDCHNPHSLTEDAKQALAEELGKSSQICATCHNDIYVEYASSVHGDALINEQNPDVATCQDCHGTHQISDPHTAESRNASPELCSECHTDETIMAKYDLSTNVMSTYIADFHGTTVTLFDKISPNQETNKPVCYDCHGVHDIRSVDDPLKGIQIKENLLVTCQKCHPDANLEITDSWLSHYEPSPEKFPIVYYVDLFYKIFIPVVLGGMGVFVVTDFGRRMYNRSQLQKQKDGKTDEAKEIEKIAEETEPRPEVDNKSGEEK